MMERNPLKPGGSAALATPGLDLALSRIGFNPATGKGARPAPAPPPARKPAPKPAPKPAKHAEQTQIALDLARREWLLTTMEAQRRLSDRAGGLLRCATMERQQFLDHFYAPGRPCLVTGAIAHWPALGRWTPAYLRAAIGNAMVEYQGDRSRPDFELAKEKLTTSAPFGAFLDRILARAGNDAYVTASNSAANRAAFAPLLADTGPIPFCLGAGDGLLWIGPAGTFTPLHFDLTNNLLVQVTGRKRVLLMPPAETRNLYHRLHVFSEVHDLEDPERLQDYPLARQISPFEVILEPGDVLFMPLGWWHQVRALEFSVMLTYTSFLWPNGAHQSYPPNPV